jgi:DNA-3-methyladenine glycosylase I
MVEALSRCAWCGTDPLYVRYHDEEWGVPVHDDLTHFEFLLLEGAQAGLSWITVLRKRESYREAFAGFDPERVARFGRREINRLLGNPGIVRNRLKVEGAVRNARAFLALRDEMGGFDPWVWGFAATTPDPDALSRELRRRGFTFVGPTIAHAYMQAVGLVNDHVAGCFRRRELAPTPTRSSRGASTRCRRPPG